MANRVTPLLGFVCFLALLASSLAGCGSAQPVQPSATAAPGDSPVKEVSPTEASAGSPSTASPQAGGSQAPPGSPTAVSGEVIDGENGAEQIDWGQEVSPEKLLKLARSEDLFEIQWHVMPNVIRILMKGGEIYHVKNEKLSLDILKYLENAGIKVGKGGITFRYSFCN